MPPIPPTTTCEPRDERTWSDPKLIVHGPRHIDVTLGPLLFCFVALPTTSGLRWQAGPAIVRPPVSAPFTVSCQRVVDAQNVAIREVMAYVRQGSPMVRDSVHCPECGRLLTVIGLSATMIERVTCGVEHMIVWPDGTIDAIDVAGKQRRMHPAPTATVEKG